MRQHPDSSSALFMCVSHAKRACHSCRGQSEFQRPSFHDNNKIIAIDTTFHFSSGPFGVIGLTLPKQEVS